MGSSVEGKGGGIMNLIKVPIRRGGPGQSKRMFLMFKLLRKYGGYIAGGYARWMVSPRESPVLPEDLDVYGKSSSGIMSMADMASAYYMNMISSGENLYNSNRIWTYQDSMGKLPNIQFIGLQSGAPEYVLETFDLGICQAAVTPEGGFVGEGFMEEERNLEIKVKNISPSMHERIFKYINKGYMISPEEIVRVKYVEPLQRMFFGGHLYSVENPRGITFNPATWGQPIYNTNPPPEPAPTWASSSVGFNAHEPIPITRNIEPLDPIGSAGTTYFISPTGRLTTEGIMTNINSSSEEPTNDSN
jgi:hypothetical protein